MSSSTALFEPCNLGPLELSNRLVRSAAYEAMAAPDGAVTPALVRLYRSLGRGEIGAVVTGYMNVRADGKAAFKQVGIEHDRRVPGLAQLAAAIKERGSRAIFQLHHAGASTISDVTGYTPLSPSAAHRDPMFFSKAQALTVAQIEQLIASFAAAARRAAEAGADGIQLHAAHGYLINQFLSPFHNLRQDDWGGSAQGRYRFLGQVLAAVRAEVGQQLAVLVKLSVDDGTPQPGCTAESAADVAGRLARDGIDGVEISSGATTWAPFTMSRGAAPAAELSRAFPWLLRGVMRKRIQANAALSPPFEEAYHAAAAPAVKAALGQVPLILVGGNRTLEQMELQLEAGHADLISLCRPFVRQPRLAQLLRDKKATAASCTNCNNCFAGVAIGLPLRCYAKGLPR